MMSELTETLPADWYVSASMYELERQRIFSRAWMYAAHASELEQPGDYLSCRIAGYPLFLLRQRDGSIKAFHNVCRHRASPLVSHRTGNLKGKTVSCPYHGWSYDQEGRLVAAPHLDCLTDCERTALSLYPVRVETFRGLVFVNLSPEVPPFSETFSELIDVVGRSNYPLESYRLHSKMTRQGNFNWKVWIDGYQECYHCSTIHPCLKNDFLLKEYKVENRKLFSEHSCQRKEQSSSGASEGLWLWVYPNLGLPVYEPCFYSLQVNPTGPSTTELTYTFHARDSADENLITEFLNFIDQLTDEDIGICESVQSNLESGVFQSGVLHGTRENGVAYFQSLVRQALEGSEKELELDHLSHRMVASIDSRKS